MIGQSASEWIRHTLFIQARFDDLSFSLAKATELKKVLDEDLVITASFHDDQLRVAAYNQSETKYYQLGLKALESDWSEVSEIRPGLLLNSVFPFKSGAKLILFVNRQGIEPIEIAHTFLRNATLPEKPLEDRIDSNLSISASLENGTFSFKGINHSGSKDYNIELKCFAHEQLISSSKRQLPREQVTAFQIENRDLTKVILSFPDSEDVLVKEFEAPAE